METKITVKSQNSSKDPIRPIFPWVTAVSFIGVSS